MIPRTIGYTSPGDISQRGAIVVLLTVILSLLAGGSAGVLARTRVADQMAMLAAPADAIGIWILNGQTTAAPAMRAAGAKWARIAISWRTIESSPGVYNWSSADSRVDYAQQQGYQIVLAVMSNPSWAAATECGPLYAQHIATYANFMKAVVQRYSVSPHNIRYFELGNEPDNADVAGFGWVGGCWGKGPGQAEGAGGAAYANMLKTVYPAMKAANANIIVAMGGLSYESWWSEGGPFDPNFLTDLLAAGGGAYFDVINYHFYEAFSYKWGSVVGKGQVLQEKVRQATGQTKPLMITEIGTPSQ